LSEVNLIESAEGLWSDNPLISGPAIQKLLEQCPDLNLLAFMDTTLDETVSCCRVASTTGKLDVPVSECRTLHAGWLLWLISFGNSNNNQGTRRSIIPDHSILKTWRILAQNLH
jgi:hypothetical protein